MRKKKKKTRKDCLRLDAEERAELVGLLKKLGKHAQEVITT